MILSRRKMCLEQNGMINNCCCGLFWPANSMTITTISNHHIDSLTNHALCLSTGRTIRLTNTLTPPGTFLWPCRCDTALFRPPRDFISHWEHLRSRASCLFDIVGLFRLCWFTHFLTFKCFYCGYFQICGTVDLRFVCLHPKYMCHLFSVA